ncbi:MAG: glycosyltransferase family 4 protein [Anaerolineales bacterium]
MTPVPEARDRILICRSNPVAPDPRVAKAAAALAAAGYPVQVICWDRTGALPLEQTLASNEGISITRLPLAASYASGIGNLPALLRWQWRLLLRQLKERRNYDIIHACDFDTMLPALVLKAISGKKVVYDVFDFYADHLRKTPGFIKSVIRRLDYWAINRVDAVILADENRKEQIRGTRPRHLAIIYNTPEEPKIKLEESHNKSAFSIAYIGLLQVERGLLELLNVMGKHPEWTLTLAGFGGDEERLGKESAKLENVTWRGRIPYEEALRVSAEADVLIATYDPKIPNHKYASPNKLFEAMMLAKPIIVARGTNMDVIVERWNMGLVMDYGDVTALERAIAALANDNALRKTLEQNARRAYETEYNWNIMKQRLLDLYEKVASGVQG